MTKKCMVGNTYGQITIIEDTGGDTVTGKCSCGTIKEVKRYSVRRIGVGKCLCKIKKEIKGGSYTRLYLIWNAMLQRCKKTGGYYKYGVKVCDSWHNYCEFKQWAMVAGYMDTLTIERKDSSKDYCPNNCCWIPASDQHRTIRPRATAKASKYKGVSKKKGDKKFQVLVRLAGVTYRVGRFLNEEDAARAYNRAALDLFGEGCYLNSVDPIF